MSRVFLLALTALALTIGASTAEAQTKMTKNFWVHTGAKFRRGGAEGALLGSAGVVRKTFLKAFDYERKEALGRKLLGPSVELKVRRPTRVTGSSVNERVARRLVRRGHRVPVLGDPAIEPGVLAAGARFAPFLGAAPQPAQPRGRHHPGLAAAQPRFAGSSARPAS